MSKQIIYTIVQSDYVTVKSNMYLLWQIPPAIHLFTSNLKIKSLKALRVPDRLNSGLKSPRLHVADDVTLTLLTPLLKMALRPGSGGGGRYLSPFNHVRTSSPKRDDSWPITR